MSILQKTFEKLLDASSQYAELKQNVAELTRSVNELAKSIMELAQAVRTHHIVISELLSFQKDIASVIGDVFDIELVDETKLN